MAGAQDTAASDFLQQDGSERLAEDAYRSAQAGPRNTRAKAEALRQAQVELLRASGSAGGSKGTARFEHPPCWAPFVLIGKWR
jgi:CHAT domain-containing protein